MLIALSCLCDERDGHSYLCWLIEEPVSCQDAMNGVAILDDVSLLAVHHDEGEVMTAGSSRSLQESFDLPVIEFGCRIGEVVGDLDKLCDMSPVNNSKVHLIAAVLPDVVEFFCDVLHAAQQFDGYGVFQSPSPVLGFQGIGVIGDESRVDGVGLAEHLAFRALERIARYEPDEVGFLDIGDIVHDRVDGLDMIVSHETFIVDLLAELVQQSICYLLKCFLIADVIATADVFAHDGIKEAGHVLCRLIHIQCFRQSTLHEVVVKGISLQPLSLGCKPFGIYMKCCAVFPEREREKADLVVAACEMCTQLVTEKVGIAACEYKMDLLAQEPVDKERPLIDVLHLVQQEVCVRSVDAIEHLLKLQHVFCLECSKDGVIEVGIGKGYSACHQGLLAQGGLAASPYAYDNLRQLAVKMHQLLLGPGNKTAEVGLYQFLTLAA